MNENVAKIFNSSAKEYDKQRKELLPLFNEFYGTAIEVMDVIEDGKVLDLGAGTGLLTEWAMKKSPKATYTLVDIAEDMLVVARERFKGCNNVNFQLYDYREGMGDEKYNSIISSMSIHHLDYNEKSRLYKDIFNSLEEGGVFVNADQVKGEDDESEEIQKKYQLDYIENSSISREEKDKTYDRIKLDKMDTMSDQISMLKDAGFKSVDIYYKFYNYIVFRCRK